MTINLTNLDNADTELFEKARFEKSGDFLHYRRATGERVFIARNKHSKGDAPRMITHLIQNWTVNGYLTELADSAPLPVMMKRGFLPGTIRRLCRQRGFPETPAGYDALLTAQINLSYRELKAEGVIA